MQKKQRVPPRTGHCGGGAYEKHGRFWAVTDAAGHLICLAVYKKGAAEVLRRLTAAAATTAKPKRRTRPGRKQRRQQRGD